MTAKKISGTAEQLPIKRLLRRTSSLDYFRPDGWTSRPEEAHSFSDVVEAVETCARYGLSNVELALRYETGSCDLFCTPIR
ncbi:MAG TPA: hypothetical protein VHI52_00585 [Verrucomicrobiae bacterium]|jgi:hypothetical protein|nr:hypothetical protein [Verrucomicrobiae bacterium]